MARKNPENRPLRIVKCSSDGTPSATYKMVNGVVLQALVGLAQAEAELVRGGKDSAMPHFVAIVKEIEDICGFRFEQIPDEG